MRYWMTSHWNKIVHVYNCYMKLGSNICELVTTSVMGFLKMKFKFEVKTPQGSISKIAKK
jgi:hypothetical protein